MTCRSTALYRLPSILKAEQTMVTLKHPRQRLMHPLSCRTPIYLHRRNFPNSETFLRPSGAHVSAIAPPNMLLSRRARRRVVAMGYSNSRPRPESASAQKLTCSAVVTMSTLPSRADLAPLVVETDEHRRFVDGLSLRHDRICR